MNPIFSYEMAAQRERTLRSRARRRRLLRHDETVFRSAPASDLS